MPGASGIGIARVFFHAGKIGMTRSGYGAELIIVDGTGVPVGNA
jgi:hypothetical protein